MEGSVEKEEQWGRLGVEWADPKELPKELHLYQLIHELKNEERDHSCSKCCDKTCISIKIPRHF